MTPRKKLITIIILFILLLGAFNWSYAYTYDRASGTTSEAVTAHNLSLSILVIVIVFLLSNVARLIDRMKIDNLSIRRRWSLFIDWRLFAICSPLFFQSYSINSGVQEDGVIYTKTFNYGGEHSLWLYLGAIFAIGLFRFIVETYTNHPTIKPENKSCHTTSYKAP